MRLSMAIDIIQLQQEVIDAIERRHKVRGKTYIDEAIKEVQATQDVQGLKKFLEEDKHQLDDKNKFLVHIELSKLNEIKIEKVDTLSSNPDDSFRIDAAIKLLESVDKLSRDKKTQEKIMQFANQLVEGNKSPDDVLDFVAKNPSLSNDHPLKEATYSLAVEYHKQTNEQLLKVQEKEKTQHYDNTTSQYYTTLQSQWQAERGLIRKVTPAEETFHFARIKSADCASRLLASSKEKDEKSSMATNVTQNITSRLTLLKSKGNDQIASDTLASLEPIAKFVTEKEPALDSA